MSETLKRWQTKIELDYPSNIHASKRITTYLYGETIKHLKSEVRAYLHKHRPLSFNNEGDHSYYRKKEQTGCTKTVPQHTSWINVG